MFESPGPIAFSIGSFPIHWYGILIVTGIICAYIYAILEAKRRGLDDRIIDDMSVWVVLGGVLGARIYYVLFNLPHYLQNPLEIPQLWNGGLAIHGALLGGAAVYFFFMLRRKLSPLTFMDVIVPGVLVAQAIGRWGNFFNSEAFGGPTTLPWGLFIPTDLRPPELVEHAFFHPTFLYESLWNLLGFIIILILSRRPRFMHSPGAIIGFYLMYYSVGRFFIEGLRTDSLWLGPLRAAQVVSILAFVGGIFLMRFAFKKRH